MNRCLGDLYLEIKTRHSSSDKDLAFTAGFICGQAEKVYSGVCLAAMFRFSPKTWEQSYEAAADIAARYGLMLVNITTDKGREAWICRDNSVASMVFRLSSYTENSPAWHEHRAWLCGIPPAEVDSEYHKREGWGM